MKVLHKNNTIRDWVVSIGAGIVFGCLYFYAIFGTYF